MTCEIPPDSYTSPMKVPAAQQQNILRLLLPNDAADFSTSSALSKSRKETLPPCHLMRHGAHSSAIFSGRRQSGRPQEMLHQVSLERCIAHRQQYFAEGRRRLQANMPGHRPAPLQRIITVLSILRNSLLIKTASVRTAHQNFIFRRRQRFRLGGKGRGFLPLSWNR